MHISVWISSGLVLLAGVGCAGATLFGAGPFAQAEPPVETRPVAFVPPATGTRIAVAYHGRGGDAFADVVVATAKPFDADGDGHPDDLATIRGIAAPSAQAEGDAPSLLHSDLLVEVGTSKDGTSHRGATKSLDDGRPARAIIPSTWQSRYFTDNPLVGTIYDGDGGLSSETALMGAAKGARYLLLGEIHDNPDHHRIQADIVDSLAAAGEKPAVVFEMIPQSFADTLNDFEASPKKDLSALAGDLKWDERGWPDFSLYRPIFEAAVRGDLSIEPGDLDRTTIGAIGRRGLDALSAADVSRLSLDRPLQGDQTAALAEEIKAAHCGLMPDGAIEPMALVQRARDGSLADAMTKAAAIDGSSVLIAGAGHARTDRGVPSILAERDPGAASVAVQMVEVDENDRSAADYGLSGETPAPYDFTIFTPRSDTSDHCAALRARMEGSAK